jgi:hypothetical protein
MRKWPSNPVIRLLTALLSSRAAREQIGVFASHLLLNASMFAVVFIASLKLQPSEFAKFSMANNFITQLAIFIGFGLDHGAIKLSLERGSSSFVAINLFVKAALFILASSLFLIWTILIEFRSELVVFAAAAGVAFWLSTITVAQFERKFMRLALLNVTLAATRSGFSLVAATFHNWVLIVVALHMMAQLPIHVVTLATRMRELRSAIRWRDLRALLALSPLIFASGALFSALPLVTQSLLYARTDALATSAFGVVLIFAAPVHTLAATLHIYLLPQALSRNIRDVDVFGLGQGSMNHLVLGFVAVLLAATVPAAFVLELIYGNRIPLVSSFFVIYFGALVLSVSLGFYNIRAQRWMLIRIELAVNVCRAAATGTLVLFPTIGPIAIVAWSSVILIVGEVVLWAALRRAEQVRMAAN